MLRFALRTLVVSLVLSALIASNAGSQTRSRVFTTPNTPKRGQLESLNLIHMWSANLPMEDKRDGVHDVWFIGGQVLAQTHRGVVACYDAENGSQLWHTLPGQPYQVTSFLAWNNKLVFAVNNGSVHAINRKTGNIDWRFPLGSNPSGPMVADELQLFIPTENSHIIAVHLPQPPVKTKTRQPLVKENEIRIGGRGVNVQKELKKDQELAKDALRNPQAKTEPSPDAKEPPAAPKPGAAPMPPEDPIAKPQIRTLDDDIQVYEADEPILMAKLNWAGNTRSIIPFRPLITEKYVQAVNYQGETYTFLKEGNLVLKNTEELHVPGLQITGRVNHQPVQHNKTSYLATSDGVIIAVDIEKGTKLWERTIGSAADRPLFCTEEDVFVITSEGLTRIDASTGAIAWNFSTGLRRNHFQPGISNVVSVNPKFVYAYDHQGHLHIFDRRLGRELASVNWSDFNVPIPNFSSDRLLLVSQSGKLVCLRDREFTLAELHGKGENVMDDTAAQKVAADTLQQKSQIQENPKITLRDLMAQVAARHRIKVFFSDGAFRDINLAPIADKVVKVAGPGTQTLGEHLKAILDPLNATVFNVGGLLMVVPKPGTEPTPATDPVPPGEKPPVPPGEKPPADPADPKDPPAEKPPEAPEAPKPGAKPGVVPPSPPA